MSRANALAERRPGAGARMASTGANQNCAHGIALVCRSADLLACALAELCRPGRLHLNHLVGMPSFFTARGEAAAAPRCHARSPRRAFELETEYLRKHRWRPSHDGLLARSEHSDTCRFTQVYWILGFQLSNATRHNAQSPGHFSVVARSLKRASLTPSAPALPRIRPCGRFDLRLASSRHGWVFRLIVTG